MHTEGLFLAGWRGAFGGFHILGWGHDHCSGGGNDAEGGWSQLEARDLSFPLPLLHRQGNGGGYFPGGGLSAIVLVEVKSKVLGRTGT